MLHFWLSWLVLVGPIITDIGGWLTGPFKKVGELASAVWKAIKHVVAWATGIFGNVGGAWWMFHQALEVLGRGIDSVASAAYSQLRFLVHSLVPQWARKAITDAIDWVIRNVKTIATKAVKLANGALTWAKTAVRNVRSALAKVRDFLLSKVNSALHWITKRGNDLWNLVMHPGRLVTWIMPHLVTPLARWILAHLGSLSTLILRWFFSNVGKFALEIERAFTRIF